MGLEYGNDKVEDWQGDYTDPTPRPGQYFNYTLFMVIRITGVRDQFWKWGVQHINWTATQQ